MRGRNEMDVKQANSGIPVPHQVGEEVTVRDPASQGDPTSAAATISSLFQEALSNLHAQRVHGQNGVSVKEPPPDRLEPGIAFEVFLPQIDPQYFVRWIDDRP